MISPQTYTDDLELLQILAKKKSPFFLSGCDEVGRGPLAGPVVGASVGAVVWNEEGLRKLQEFLESLRSLGVTDSKKLTSIKRQKILSGLHMDFKNQNPSQVLTLWQSHGVWVGQSLVEAGPEKIDSMNILRAALYCMGEATWGVWTKAKEEQVEISAINFDLGVVLVDGNQIPTFPGPTSFKFCPLVKGDSRSLLIGLASVMAKEYRDHLMEKMDGLWPQYGFRSHFGYPTPAHKEAIGQFGPCPIHRRSFAGVKEHCL